MLKYLFADLLFSDDFVGFFFLILKVFSAQRNLKNSNSLKMDNYACSTHIATDHKPKP